MSRAGSAGPVWVVVDAPEGPPASGALDVLPVAASLGSRIEACVLGGDAELAETFGARGVSTVYLLEQAGSGAGRELGPVVSALSRLAGEAQPSLILYTATRRMRELAARTAVGLGAALVSDCTRVEIDADGSLRAQRLVYAGRATATVSCLPPGPALAILAPDAAATQATATPRTRPEVHQVAMAEDPPARIHVERFWRPGPREMDVGEAEVIVGGGRGMATPEGFDRLAELAELLGGAVGASRPVVDAGVASYDRQIGLSGRTVTPRLYIACAISGAPHHAIGIRDAGALIAINRDPHAPIFELADLGIVAEVDDVLPAVIARLREAKRRGAGTDTAEIVDLFAEMREGAR